MTSLPQGNSGRVRSEPIKSAVLRQQQLDRARPGFERGAALTLLSFSFLGTIAAVHPGGWATLRALHIFWPAVVAGVALQALCTALQYFYRHRRLSPIYLLALVLDAGPTALGFGPLVLPLLLGALTTAGLAAEPARWAAYGAIFLGALLLAWVPEGRLID